MSCEVLLLLDATAEYFESTGCPACCADNDEDDPAECLYHAAKRVAAAVRAEEAGRREVGKLRRAIEQAPCPWTACCREHKHPTRQSDEPVWRRCWKAKALDWPPGGSGENAP